MIPESVEQLEKEYINDEWSYIDAIEILVNNFSYSTKEAEAKVESWED